MDAQETWPWPDSLDALVADPDHHSLLLENERVRVLEPRIRAGDRTPLHTHRWPAVFLIVSWSDFVRYDEIGHVIVDSRQVETLRSPPSTLWSATLPPHALENVGTTDIQIVSVEVKDRSITES